MNLHFNPAAISFVECMDGKEKNKNRFSLKKIHQQRVGSKFSVTFRAHRSFHNAFQLSFSVSRCQDHSSGSIKYLYVHKWTVKQWSDAANNGHVLSPSLVGVTFYNYILFTFICDGRYQMTVHAQCTRAPQKKAKQKIIWRRDTCTAFEYKVRVTATCSYECNE